MSLPTTPKLRLITLLLSLIIIVSVALVTKLTMPPSTPTPDYMPEAKGTVKEKIYLKKGVLITIKDKIVAKKYTPSLAWIPFWDQEAAFTSYNNICFWANLKKV